MKRSHRSGHLYLKWGAYYGRWRAPDGRLVNRRIGRARRRGESEGLSRTEAERALRRLIEAESLRRPPTIQERPRTVDDAAAALRDRLAVEGARLSYRQNGEPMQRVHISPAIGKRRVETVTRQDVERLARSMLRRAGAEDGSERDDVPAQRVRARARVRLGRGEPGCPRGAGCGGAGGATRARICSS